MKDIRKTYQVELVTTQQLPDGEDFWMYRGYTTKFEALEVAKIMSKFFPYYKYPAEILVKEYDVINKTCQNEKIIKRYKLKDENGRVVK